MEPDMTTTQQQSPTQRPPVASSDSPAPADSPYLFRLAHWLLGGSMIVLSLTGLSIHASSRPGWSVFNGRLPEGLWAGRVGLWHLVAAAVFLPAILAGLWACRKRGLLRRGAHLALLGGGLAMAVTGALRLETPPGDLWGPIAVFIHAALGLIALPVVFLWHALCGLTWRRRLLVASFRPFRGARLKALLGLVVLAALTTWVLAGFWPLAAPWRVLTVKRIDARGGGTTDLAALPWDQASPLRVRLADGANLRGGQTLMTLRALHDGQDLFVRAEWEDPTEDRLYRPWKKTADGWERLTDSPEYPNVYYEDKLSMVFPIDSAWQFGAAGCLIDCHVDAKQAYGYKGGPVRIDCWHWKAARTDPVAQVDDKYWTALDPAGGSGRKADPKSSGGYKDNVDKDKKGPAWLGAAPLVLGGAGGAQTRPAPEACTKEAADKLPPGTLVPGVTASLFVGDRGDVTCQSVHTHGRWTVYLRRRLDTGSEFDAIFAPGGRTPFGIAAFDCTSDRHAYALRPCWMVFE